MGLGNVMLYVIHVAVLNYNSTCHGHLNVKNMDTIW